MTSLHLRPPMGKTTRIFSKSNLATFWQPHRVDRDLCAYFISENVPSKTLQLCIRIYNPRYYRFVMYFFIVYIHLIIQEKIITCRATLVSTMYDSCCNYYINKRKAERLAFQHWDHSRAPSISLREDSLRPHRVLFWDRGGLLVGEGGCAWNEW